ncbi:MAG: TetR/AcrR family transcriptional regulator [Deltaproteobacteria bacterium]|nr:MAG: TetR/AcrR family transcriptional regulator [Deltaproteobacteria bacterium]
MNGRTDERNETAAKILDAADELLVEGGVNGLSSRGVATRAGVNNALVFYYFGSKQGLVERVIERYYQRHVAALEAATGMMTGDLRERLHALVDAYVDFMEAHRRFPRLVQALAASGSDFHELIGRHMTPLFRWVEHALDGVAPATGPLAARHLYLTVSGVVTSWYSQAPLMAGLWDRDPESAAAADERRAHVHWLVDAMYDKLVADAM